MGLRAIAELERVPVTLFVCPSHVTEKSELRKRTSSPAHGRSSLSTVDVVA